MRFFKNIATCLGELVQYLDRMVSSQIFPWMRCTDLRVWTNMTEALPCGSGSMRGHRTSVFFAGSENDASASCAVNQLACSPSGTVQANAHLSESAEPTVGSKHILIVSGFCAPEITPRAFRTAELVRELCRRGHRVTLVLPNKAIYHDQPFEVEGLTMLYSASPIQENGAVPVRRRLRRYVPEWAMRMILYIYNHEYFVKYDRGLTTRLMEIEGEFDALISLSYPVAVHRAAMYALRHNKRLHVRRALAEFSDPPMRGEYNARFFPLYHRFLYRMGRVYDWFVIPVENAISCYTRYKPVSEIAVIPQGFDFSRTSTAAYQPHEVPTFAYAGRFYRNTRELRYFLEYLAGRTSDFRFVLYLIQRDEYFDRMIDEYRPRLRGTIEVHDGIPREALIERLGTMDFIVNFEFTYKTATASKLIDYSLANRPVVSFSELTFDPAVFDRFLAGDYTDALTLPDRAQYDIRNVAARFLELIG